MVDTTKTQQSSKKRSEQSTEAEQGLRVVSDRLAGSFGALLQAARQRKDLSLEDVHMSTNISLVYLEALENQRYDILPIDTFVAGYIRCYTELLGLDSDALLREYRLEREALDRLNSKSKTKSKSKSKSKAFGATNGLDQMDISLDGEEARANLLIELAVRFWKIGLVAFAILVVFVFQYFYKTPVEKNIEIDEVKVLRSDGSLMVEHIDVATEQVGEPQPIESNALAMTKEVEAQAAAKAVVSTPKVLFSLVKDSWIEVKELDGETLFKGKKIAGSELLIDFKKPLQVKLGYAPGVTVKLNGEVFNMTPYLRRSSNTAAFTINSDLI